MAPGCDRCEQINALLAALKLCQSSSYLNKGKQLHTEAIRYGNESNTYAVNGLVTMYSKCCCMVDAQQIFEAMPRRDVVSWNALIAGYAGNGEEDLALEVFASMQREGYKPDARSFVAVLKAVASLAAAEQGREVEGRLVKEKSLMRGSSLHDQAQKSGFHSNIFVANTVVDMYAKAGSLTEARRVFDQMPCRSVVSWNAMLLGYADNGEAEQGMKLFQSMHSQECCELPDARTFVAALKNCSIQSEEEDLSLLGGKLVKAKSLEQGMAIHAEAARRGKERDDFVTSSLVDMYARCGSMADARRAFDRSMPHCSVVSWNALLLGYVANGEAETAIEFLSLVQSPDAVTFVAALKACAVLAPRDKIKNLEQGMYLHSRAAKLGYETETSVSTALLDIYIKCGSLSNACRVFNTSPRRHQSMVNSLITGLVEDNEPEKALELFHQLCLAESHEECGSDPRVFAAALKACGCIASIKVAAAIHAEINRLGLLDKDRVLVTCMVDSYSKCGDMAAAQRVFDALASRDLVAWNSLLSGYSHNGDHSKVLELFQEMQQECRKPDAVTFMAVLGACSHCGLVDRGRRYFEAMVSSYEIQPEMEHYHCMVDMFGRANRMDDALATVRQMPFRASAVTWTIVLAACHKWKDAVTGRVAFEALVAIDDEDTGVNGGYLQKKLMNLV